MHNHNICNRKYRSAVIVTRLALCYLIASHASADVLVETFSAKPLGLQLYITKTVSSGDAAKMAREIEDATIKFGEAPFLLVDLDSDGGSVSASLTMGRLLRKYGAMATVRSNAKCFSSCVYILAGAPRRAVDGTVGIHRPYDPNDEQTSDSAQAAKYQTIGKHMVAYLKEMNVPTRLYEDSIFISPERIKLLSPEELQTYGLSENDPYIDEADAVREAKKLRITRAELAARRSRASAECDFYANPTREDFDAEIACQDGILQGRDRD